ncbi:MAG: DnaT-like ssDNA-binding protein [Pseudomonadota bacterium]
MTLTVGTDSYVTREEADAYASLRSWTTWAALTDPAKDAVLLDAASYLDLSYDWKGSIASTSQAMAWPRQGVVDHEGRTVDSASVPARVKNAQIELANIAVANGGQLVTNQTERDISRVQAGSVSVSFNGPAVVAEEDRFKSVDRLLYGLLDDRTRLDDESDNFYQIRSIG